MHSIHVSKPRNDRGVALLIVLLVTALLIALIFEFAYGTRVSMRAAVNYRDSQRAYFLARAGFGVFAKYPDLRKKVPHGMDSGPIPYVSEGDTSLNIRWEDESGKISIYNATKTSDAYNRLTVLFDILEINTAIVDQISTWMTEEKKRFNSLTELHRFLSDEDYRKVQDLLTVSDFSKINVNTASALVLRSLGVKAEDAENIVRLAEQSPFDDQTIENAPGMNPSIKGQLVYSNTLNNIYKITSTATVGRYTKKIEAIITLTGSGFTVKYWRAI
jgi:general secretion pathway protein K